MCNNELRVVQHWFQQKTCFAIYCIPSYFAMYCIPNLVPGNAPHLVLSHIETPQPFQPFISELWKFSNVRRGLVAFVLNNSHRKQGQIVQSFPAFLRVLFLELRALARILFLADLAFLSLNLEYDYVTSVQATFKESSYLSRSVRPALLALTAILLAQVELAQVSST